MPLKTVTPHKLEQPFHLAMIVDILGEDVFTQGIARRAVDEKEVAIAVRPGQLAQELPAALIVVSIGGRFELLARPEDRPLRADVEPVRVEHRPLVVVAQQT